MLQLDIVYDSRKTKNLLPKTCHSRWMSEEYEPGLVSVIMPTYNRSSMITDAMSSVFTQTYRPIELIVIDDGSTDNTSAVIKKWSQDHLNDIQFNLCFIEQQNKGASSARNLGLIKSFGQYIQFLDSDDLLSSEKIKDAVNVMEKDKDIDMVYSLRANIDSKTGNKIAWDAKLADFENNLSPSEVALKSVWTALPIYRRNIILNTGPWNEELSCFQDWEYIGRTVVFLNKCRKINTVQAFCRQHNKSRLSVNHWGKTEGLISKVKANRSIYNLIMAFESENPKKMEALEFLATSSMSRVRVAIGSGQPELAKKILFENKDILRNKPWGFWEAIVWSLFSRP